MQCVDKASGLPLITLRKLFLEGGARYELQYMVLVFRRLFKKFLFLGATFYLARRKKFWVFTFVFSLLFHKRKKLSFLATSRSLDNVTDIAVVGTDALNQCC